LLAAWEEFLRGKRKRSDTEAFSMHLTDHIISLHRDLVSSEYRHGPYTSFVISDPKTRHVHKASVRDRLLHHALHRVLYPFFDRFFIYDSYSCRRGKGMHRAMNRFRQFGRQVSRNGTRTAWVLQCDIRKFFNSIDHNVLMRVLAKKIACDEILWLLGQIIDSFHAQGKQAVGLPLGNLTSQLLVNIYMNEFDQFVKRSLKMSHYIRYADDFVVLHHDRRYLEGLLQCIRGFLASELKLELHPQKIKIKTLASGVDFLGWIHFQDHRVLRTATKRRVFRGMENNPNKSQAASYLGLLSHGNTRKLAQKLLKILQ
jgi:RNA-directed DNA polymerase